MTEPRKPSKAAKAKAAPKKPATGNDALAAMVAGLATRVAEMNEHIEQMPARVAVLADRIDTKPSRRETVWRSRSRLFLVLFIIFASMQVADQHTETCGPGHRAEVIIDAIQRGEVKTGPDFKRIADKATPSWVCGLTFPLHTHNRRAWPQQQHVAGLAMYSAIFLGLGWWTWSAHRDLKREHELEAVIDARTGDSS